MSRALEPLVPFITLDDIVLVPARTLGEFQQQPLSIRIFGLLVALSVWLGAWVSLRQGQRRGLDQRALTSFLVWVTTAGFVFAHVLDSVLYYPDEVRRDPLSLLRLWEGLSSFGGFVGACIGGFAWRAYHRSPILPYADVLCSALPFSWLVGRLGCALVHDHPGVESQLFFAVRYPGGGRLDLGLIELAITLPLAAIVLTLWRRPRAFGTYAALACIYYAPLRFALDFWRARAPVPRGGVLTAADARYFELTPAQYACIAFLAIGLGLLLYLRRKRGSGELLLAPAPPRAFRDVAATPADAERP